MQHATEHALGLYALDAAQLPDRLRQHIEQCDSCLRDVATISSFDERLKDPAAWGEQPTGPKIDALRAFKARHSAEYAYATLALKPYERREAAAQFAYDVSVVQELQTGGAVTRFCEMARDMAERHPLYALTLAETAVAISAQLPTSRFPREALHELRGQALVEHATALRFLGRFAEAAESLKAAEAEFDRLSHDTIGAVNALYCAAAIALEQERPEQAVMMASKAAAVALAIGDEYRHFTSLNLLGIAEFDRQRYDAALRIFEELLAGAEAAGHVRWIALQLLNAGRCQIEQGELGAALVRLGRAHTLYLREQVDVGVTRVGWAIAVAEHRSGKTIDAIHRLRNVVSELTRSRMLTDAAEAAVDLAEMLSALSRSREAAKVLSGVAATLASAGKVTSALTALAYLKDAVARGGTALDADAVTHVRRFVRRAERQPSLVFEPR